MRISSRPSPFTSPAIVALNPERSVGEAPATIVAEYLDRDPGAAGTDVQAAVSKQAVRSGNPKPVRKRELFMVILLDTGKHPRASAYHGEPVFFTRKHLIAAVLVKRDGIKSGSEAVNNPARGSHWRPKRKKKKDLLSGPQSCTVTAQLQWWG